MGLHHLHHHPDPVRGVHLVCGARDEEQNHRRNHRTIQEGSVVEQLLKRDSTKNRNLFSMSFCHNVTV
jgi:hypothetical protein